MNIEINLYIRLKFKITVVNIIKPIITKDVLLPDTISGIAENSMINKSYLFEKLFCLKSIKDSSTLVDIPLIEFKPYLMSRFSILKSESDLIKSGASNLISKYINSFEIFDISS